MKTAKKQNKIPLPKAVLAIFLSIVLVSGSSLIGVVLYKNVNEKKKVDPSNTIVAVVQTSPDAEGLKTAYLVEMLELSVDRPMNLYNFNAKEAEMTLLDVPVIKQAKVRKILPGTIHVDYVRRKPIAYFKDYTNTAIDDEGVLFPFKPFYTPKRLPEIITGQLVEGETVWGKKINNMWTELALTLIDLLPAYSDDYSVLCCVDVSRAFATMEGQREIVLTLENRVVRVIDGQSVLCVYPRILRLSPSSYMQQLGNYINMRNFLREKERVMLFSGHEGVRQAKPTIVDLRIADMAFVK